jgi:hypothetical protein
MAATSTTRGTPDIFDLAAAAKSAVASPPQGTPGPVVAGPTQGTPGQAVTGPSQGTLGLAGPATAGTPSATQTSSLQVEPSESSAVFVSSRDPSPAITITSGSPSPPPGNAAPDEIRLLGASAGLSTKQFHRRWSKCSGCKRYVLPEFLHLGGGHVCFVLD